MGVSEIKPNRTVKTQRIKIYLASKEVKGWNEIDAVGLVDKSGKTHWAVNAEASSTFADYGAGLPKAPLPPQEEKGKVSVMYSNVLTGTVEVKDDILYEFLAAPTSKKGIDIAKIKLLNKVKTNRIKIYLASKKVKGWNEIDAVAVIDESGNTFWATQASASSTYARSEKGESRSWGPEQAVGEPNTPQTGDYSTAWASRTPDSQDEWLLLEYSDTITPVEIHIYETYNPGAVYKICAVDDKANEMELWSGYDPLLVSKEIETDYNTPPSIFSLIADENSQQWAAEQATGEPNTLKAGDIPTAWASLTPDKQDEWLVLEYSEAIVPVTIKIYETYNPGAVYKVTAVDEENNEEELWKGTDPTSADEKMGISEIKINSNIETKRIKIYLASKKVKGWNEIDAVGIVDNSGKTYWAVAAEASSTYDSIGSLITIFNKRR